VPSQILHFVEDASAICEFAGPSCIFWPRQLLFF